MKMFGDVPKQKHQDQLEQKTPPKSQPIKPSKSTYVTDAVSVGSVVVRIIIINLNG